MSDHDDTELPYSRDLPDYLKPDAEDLDFAMLTPPTRPGPCKATSAPEVDPVEVRLKREVQAAPHIAEAVGLRGRPDAIVSGIPQDHKCGQMEKLQALAYLDRLAVEVRHGSGKVKV